MEDDQEDSELRTAIAHNGGRSSLSLGTVCVLFALEAALLVAIFSALVLPFHSRILGQARLEARSLDDNLDSQRVLRELVVNKTIELQELQTLLDQKDILRQQNLQLRTQRRSLLLPHNSPPYAVITGQPTHFLPNWYGSKPEKTIWIYYYNDTHCPDSAHCHMPAYLQFCKHTINRHKGSFNFELVHRDKVDWYLSRMDLPVHWMQLPEALQRDAVINALLARYGGVALGLATVLMRPLDDYWIEMVSKAATFRGYMYRMNGQPWRRPESSAPWFLMARREGVFSSVVRSQVIGMGDETNPARIYGEPTWPQALGDQTLTPVLGMYDYHLPRCADDETVGENRSFCPDVLPSWWNTLIGAAKNDTRIMLRDPRDGPLLPFKELGMELWNAQANDSLPIDQDTVLRDQLPGTPLYNLTCKTTKECWDVYIMRRLHTKPPPGEARTMSFVKLNEHGAYTSMSKKELLAQTHSYFYHLMKLAGLEDFK